MPAPGPAPCGRRTRPCGTIDSAAASGQGRHRFSNTKFSRGLPTVATPELGTKRLCAGCGAKFYDLSKDPIVCPKCGTVFVVMATSPRGRPDVARAPIVPEPEAAELPETADAEFVSLEEADEENKGGAKQPVAAEG